MAIYLDNAATSFPKPESVYRAVDQAFRQIGGNPGRGGHRMAIDASRLVFSAREATAEFFGIRDSARVVFTASATMALNQALCGLLRPGDRVVTTSMEHNALVRPLRQLQQRGVTVVKVAADSSGLVDPDAIRQACAEPTALVAMAHISNVTGSVQPVATIGRWCRQHGIPLLVDAAQSAGLFEIDVEEMGIDLLAVPGHKGLFGPPGTGLLYVHPGLELQPLLTGGTGTHSESDLAPEEMPERLESGTVNTPGLAGLAAGIAYLNEQGLSRLRSHESQLLQRAIDGLAAIPGVRLYGPLQADCHGGALSFTIDGLDPAEIGFRLDHDFAILVRVGLHCAPDAHRTIGTFPHGTVRVSPGPFTNAADIEALLAAVRVIAARR